MKLYSIFFILFTTLQIPIASLQSQPALGSVISDIENDPRLVHGTWSFYAKNLKTGEIIANFNSNKSVAPASGLKLISSSAALSLLGPDYIFKTYLEYSGTIKNGILNGDLFLRGEGDPTLGSDQFDKCVSLDSLFEILVKKIKETGTTHIHGNIIGDESWFDYHSTPDFWPWIHIGNYYGAGTSALTFHENLFYLFFKPGKWTGAPALVIRTEPELPDVEFFNEMKTGARGSGDNGYIYAAPQQKYMHLRGTIPAGKSEFSIKGSLPDPAQFAAFYLKKELNKANIIVKGDALNFKDTGAGKNSKRTLIYEHASPILADIVYRLNKRSVNLYAEQLVKTIGKRTKGTGSMDAGLDVIKKWLEDAGIFNGGFYMVDGSGLSRQNNVTTRLMVELLEYMHKQSYFKSFYNSLPIAGDPNDSGTMTTMCRNSIAAKNVRAKTGGIDRVRSHTGYVNNRKNELIAFSMIANDFSGSSRYIDKMHEQVMIMLAELQ